ncbi:MAG: Gfo/Idh/MocA family oxidoreductase [Lentisphaeria bacterium]|nr:Gfo/Idh/MocA family oxidoreductase [Lentisphaeria bacterium]
MNNYVGFGIIGAGMIAEMHAEALQSIDNGRLIGIYDPVIAAAESKAAQFNCKVYRTLEDMLADPEIQAVTVATPSGLHGKLCIAAAKAGKHIFCEKPLEITVEKVDEVLKACEENHVLISPVFQSRFSEPVRIVKKAMEQGRFGKMLLASVQMHWFREESYYKNSNWRGTWAMDGGGALMNQAIHVIDLLLHLNGSPKEVFAFAGTMTHDIEVEDNLCAAIKFSNGSFGTIEVSTSCAPGFPRRLELAGSKGSVAFEENTLTRWSFIEKQPEDEEIMKLLAASSDTAGGGSSPGNISKTGHAAQLKDLSEAILTGKKLFLDGYEGRRAVELICGIYESARSGKPYIFQETGK